MRACTQVRYSKLVENSDRSPDMAQDPPSLVVWLESANLGQHAEAFRAAAIDLDILHELSEDDLVELGLPLGDRRRFRQRLAASGGPRGAASIPGLNKAEHRQITVLFSDLVGWTALSTKFDSEDLHDAITQCRTIWAQAIERFGGFVASRHGDGVMAYYGHQLAHEDGAERAILSGLEIVSAMKTLQKESGSELARQLQVRVGIATGKVLVSTSGAGDLEEVDVLGYTPNLAARLQNVARPDSVVVSTTTAQLARHRFDFSVRDGVRIKGVERPLRVCDVDGPAKGTGRGPQLDDGRNPGLVGRTHEIGMLEDRWKSAREGDGRVILLSGEAGIGKSKLADTIFGLARSETTIRYRLGCWSYYSNSALRPFIEFLQSGANYAETDATDTKFEKLGRFLDGVGMTAERDHALFASLLQLSDDPDALPMMSSERQKTEMLSSIVRMLLHRAESRPTIILFEDAHWADPTSREVLERLAAEISDHRALLIVTTRDDSALALKKLPKVSSLQLSRLSKSQSIQIIRNLSPDIELSDSLAQQILDKSDGIPLFLEELTKTVCNNLAEDVEADRNRYVPGKYMTIPATLYDSLLSRLDKYPEARGVADCAAAIGSEFSETLLCDVLGMEPDALGRIVRILLKAGLFIRNPHRNDESYMFKHALVHDAVYESMTRDTRRLTHGAIAESLERSFPETVRQSPELLAQHFFLAGQQDAALRYWEQAGRLAMEHSATSEALSHLDQALALLDALPADQDTIRKKISLLTSYGAALTSVKGYTAPETVAAYDAAWSLSESLSEDAHFHEIIYGMWNSAQVGSDYDRAQVLANMCLTFSEKQDDDVSKLVAHSLSGVTSTLRGEHEQARRHLQQAIAIYDPDRFQSMALSTGEDPGVESLSYFALNSWYLGDLGGALEAADQSMALAQEIAYKHSVLYSLIMRGVVLHLAGLSDDLLGISDDIIGMSQKQNYPFFVEWGRNLKGWAVSENGDPERGLLLMSNNWRQGFSDLLRAKVNLHLGRRDTGLPLVDRIIQEQPWLAPEAHRVRGELLLLDPDAGRAEARQCFLTALEQANTQCAVSLSLKAAVSLARSEAAGGPSSDTVQLLDQVVACVRDHPRSRDLREAAELRSIAMQEPTDAA